MRKNKQKLVPYRVYFSLRKKNKSTLGWATVKGIWAFEEFMKQYGLSRDSIRRGVYLEYLKLGIGEYKLLPYSWEQGRMHPNGRLKTPVFGKPINHFFINERGEVIR